MFYTQEILTSRKGGMGVVWLAATLGTRSQAKKLTRKDYISVNIVETCAQLVTPVQPMALRLSSNLMLGVTRVYSQQCNYYYVDAQSLWLDLSRSQNSVKVDLEVHVAKMDAITLEPSTVSNKDLLQYWSNMTQVTALPGANAAIHAPTTPALTDDMSWWSHGRGVSAPSSASRATGSEIGMAKRPFSQSAASSLLSSPPAALSWSSHIQWSHLSAGSTPGPHLIDLPADNLGFDAFGLTVEDLQLQTPAHSLYPEDLMPGMDMAMTLPIKGQPLTPPQTPKPTKKRRRLQFDSQTQFTHQQMQEFHDKYVQCMNSIKEKQNLKMKVNLLAVWDLGDLFQVPAWQGQIMKLPELPKKESKWVENNLKEKDAIEMPLFEVGRKGSSNLNDMADSSFIHGAGQLASSIAGGTMPSFDGFDDTAPLMPLETPWNSPSSRVSSRRSRPTTSTSHPSNTGFQLPAALPDLLPDLNLAHLHTETLHFYQYAQSLLSENNSSVYFHQLAPPGLSRYGAASGFFHVLVLATKNLLKPLQDEAFGPIELTLTLN